MMSLFPSLLTHSNLAPFLLRLILGATLLYFAYTNLTRNKANTNDKLAAALEGVSGIFLIIGLYTQAAAIIVAIILGVRLAKKIGQKAFLTSGINYYLILFVIAITLIIGRAGAFAFDLPL